MAAPSGFGNKLYLENPETIRQVLSCFQCSGNPLILLFGTDAGETPIYDVATGLTTCQAHQPASSTWNSAVSNILDDVLHYCKKPGCLSKGSLEEVMKHERNCNIEGLKPKLIMQKTDSLWKSVSCNNCQQFYWSKEIYIDVVTGENVCSCMGNVGNRNRALETFLSNVTYQCEKCWNWSGLLEALVTHRKNCS